MTCAEADCPPEAAVIRASPLDNAVTRPVSLTLATVESLDDQATAASGMTVSFRSYTVASSCRVSPSDVRLPVSGSSATRATVIPTMTSTCADAAPARAVICVLPFFNAVTRPAALTLATVESLDDQAAGAEIAWPYWSNTAAASCAVWPMVSRLALPGVMSILVGTDGAGGSGGGVGSGCVGLSFPQDARDKTASMATVRKLARAR